MENVLRMEKKMEIRKILVIVREVFGVKRVYPISADGVLLLKLTGLKCFNEEHLGILKQLGYTLEVVPETLDAA